jgi:hypothetical protein
MLAAATQTLGKRMSRNKPVSRSKTSKCVTPTIKAEAERLAATAIEKTVNRHADDARAKKERDERLRLAARKRLTARIIAGVMTEMQDRKENGLKIDEVRLADIAADHAKQILRSVGLEIEGKKDKDHKPE